MYCNQIRLENSYAYKLSVIIVNYNVQHFIDQCLTSVIAASKQLPIEVLIVDNNSIDGSVELIKEKYAQFNLIENKENVGFSKANNQAIEISQGEYILLLNPDTVVAEDTFQKVVQFMDDHTDVGGLGVRMIDGKGRFLPESKRGLPTPMVAFYKIFGISKLFPRSKKFGQYHAGHLSDRETGEIDILSGAFMLMRKSALDKVGLLDEEFFMYGEDIDLSYRIQKGGYKNYYYPEAEIIHYKGESTKKSSVNYVFVFYRAMVIFAKKHFSGNNAWLFSMLINIGIYLRAGLALTARLIRNLSLPLFDLLYLVIGLFALTNYWKMADINFPGELIRYSIPIYGLTWVTSAYFNGGYDLPIRLFKYIKSTIIGTILILVVYAVLPKNLQFSRLFIFIGTGWVIIYYLMSRLFLHFAIGKRFKLFDPATGKTIIIGDVKYRPAVKELLKQSKSNIGDIIEYDTIPSASLDQPIEEVVFCTGSNTFKDIINFMSHEVKREYEYKIAPSTGDFLIGSNSIDTAGDLYILNINMLTNTENRRKKRLFDLVLSIALLLSSPLMIWGVHNKNNYINNLVRILVGSRSFIGFSERSRVLDPRLPKIKDGILHPCDAIGIDDDNLRDKLNLLYARDYSMRKDFSILWKAWRNLDRQ